VTMASAGATVAASKPSMKDQVPSTDTAGDVDQRTNNVSNQPTKHTGLCAPCKWYQEKPRKRYLFAVMWAVAAATVIFIPIRASSSMTGDILSGLVGIGLGLFAAQHFRTLLGLKEQLGKFAKNNREMRRQNAFLSQTVSKLNKKQEELAAVNADLMETSNQYKANIKKFEEIDQKLKTLGDDNIAGLENLREMSDKVLGSLKKEMIGHQRDILRTTYEAMEYGDDQEGMNKEEYERYLNALPQEYRDRVKKLGSFEDIAGDDGVLDLDEFTKMADNFSVDDLLGDETTTSS